MNPKGKIKTRIPRYIVDSEALKNGNTLNGVSQFNGVSRIVIQRRYLPFNGNDNAGKVAALKERLHEKNGMKRLSKYDADLITIIAQYLNKLQLK